MRGFLLGSLALIVLETLVRNGESAGTALGWVGTAVERFLSPQVAAVPNFTARKAAATAAPKASAGRPAAPVNPTVAPFITAARPDTEIPA